ncbi:MAG: hypothetical protein WEE89_02150 [Gemmatimonadota bacterium]
MRTRLMVSALLLSLNAMGASAQSSSDLFQQALRKERAEGDLPAAIKLYQRVLQGSDRVLAARALVRIGTAYETLGRNEAAESYRRILREFADQAEPVKTARTRLAALERPAEKSTGLAVRVVWEETQMDIEGRPTPDGRHLTFVDWFETGDLALRELATGKKTVITQGGDGSNVYPLQSSISRDGRQVAYFWTPNIPPFWQPQLRIINMDGTGERTLVENANHEIDYIEPSEWTPDGRHVLATFWMTSFNTQLVLVSTVDGKVRVLKSFDWRRPMRASLSPDGRWVAYDLQPDTLNPRRDLYILAADGSSEFQITHPANDLHPIWSPKGDYLLFSSDRGGSVGLWAQPMAGGRQRGDATLVQGQMADGFFPMDFTADGVLFYAQDLGGGDLYTAPFDLATLRAGEPSKLVHAHLGYNNAAYWSADGSTLAYASRRSAMSIGQTARLVVRDVRSGNERVVANGPILHRKFSRPQPSADGSRIAVWSDDNRGRRGIHIVETATGSYRQLVRFADESFEELGNPQWSRDGRAIIYPGRLRNPTRFVLIRQDVATGESKELLSSIPQVGGRIRMLVSVSPDERSVAYAGFRNDTLRIRVMPLDGGAPRDLVTMRITDGNVPNWAGLAWTPDGKHILFGVPRDRGSDVELMAVPAAGGAAQSTGLVMPELRHVSITPDGRVSFTSGPMNHQQVWTMENIFTRLGKSN